MEYIDRGNLHDVLAADAETNIRLNTKLRIARGVASGLSYIHNFKDNVTFCHGDLKPENVLLTRNFEVKLADFGAASLLLATGSLSTTLDFVSTNQQTLIYVAPEFLENPSLEKSPSMDMYRCVDMKQSKTLVKFPKLVYKSR